MGETGLFFILVFMACLCAAFHMLALAIGRRCAEAQTEIRNKAFALADSIKEDAKAEGLAGEDGSVSFADAMKILRRYVDEGLVKSHDREHGLRMAYILTVFAAGADRKRKDGKVRQAVDGMIKDICEACGPMPDKIGAAFLTVYRNALTDAFWAEEK